MEIEEALRDALYENNQEQCSVLVIKVSRMLAKQLPFPHVIVLLKNYPKILKYLIIATLVFKQQLQMIFNALQDRYQLDFGYIKLYLECCCKILTEKERYTRQVREHDDDINRFLLSNTKQLINVFMEHYLHDKRVISQVTQFYKTYLRQNTDFELLNLGFSDAIDLRDKWPELKSADPTFENDIEEQLIINNNFTQVESEKDIKPKFERQSTKLIGIPVSKQEQKLMDLEDWLFTPCETPLMVAVSHTQLEQKQFSNEIFRSKFALDALLSFLLLPTKHEQVSQFNIENITAQYTQQEPTQFRNKRVQIEDSQLAMLSFRAFRAMQALTDNHNHFLITQINREYYIRAFDIINICLSSDQVAMNICPNLVIQYLQFLLYYEADIAVYFMLNYNMPFRLLTYLDLEVVSQFLFQFIKPYNSTPYFKLPSEQKEIIWKYLELSGFFSDLMKSTLFDSAIVENILNSKATEAYKPKAIEEMLIKPDLAPLQHEKNVPIIEQKRLTEELDTINFDIDGVRQIVKTKQLKAVSIFQRMIDHSQLHSQIMEKKSTKRFSILDHQVKKSKQLSPSRRSTRMAPKLASLFEKGRMKLHTLNDEQMTTRPTNIFTILEDTIVTTTQMPSTDVPTPVFQRIMRKPPTKLLHLHNRSLSNNFRNSRLSSQVLITSESKLTARTNSSSVVIRRFNHLIGSMSEKEVPNEHFLYPPELKDLQMYEMEMLANDPQFDKDCKTNENYTRGAMQLMLDLTFNILYNMLDNINEIVMRRKKWNILAHSNEQFIKMVAKNYILKFKRQDKLDYSTCMTAGKLFNLILKKSSIVNYTFQDLEQELRIITKILLSLLALNCMGLRTITLLESFTLIIENTKQKFINGVSASFYHILLEAFQQHQDHQVFVSLFIRIFTGTFLYGNIITYNKLIMKLNCLSYLRAQVKKVKPIVLSIELMLNVKVTELCVMKKQIQLLSSWEYLRSHYSKEIAVIESGSLSGILSTWRIEDQQYIRTLTKVKTKKQ